jgi:carboxymethylenebutenolidase
MTAVQGNSIDIPTSDGVTDAYVAYPDDGAAYPGVLMYTDVFGLRGLVRDMADRLASSGYTVLVPNVYYRLGRAPVIISPDEIAPDDLARYIFQVIMPQISALTPELVMRDASAYLDWLAASEHATGGPVGVTGYCMGVPLMMHTVGTYPDRIAAGAGFHGGFLAIDSPNSPHLLAGAITAELYFGHADKDEALPPEQIERLNKALDSAGVRYHAEVYAGAPHGYTQADFARFGRFDAEATERHWRELVTLFDRTLR